MHITLYTQSYTTITYPLQRLSVIRRHIFYSIHWAKPVARKAAGSMDLGLCMSTALTSLILTMHIVIDA